MNYGNNIIVPFNMIYDIDIGMFKLLKEKYKNPKFINQLMLKITDNNFKYSILNAETYDPLSILVEEEYKYSTGVLLHELMSLEGDDYKNIVNLSTPTDILGLIAVFLKSSLVKVTVLCRSVEESNKIKSNKLLDGVSIIIESDYSKIDIKDFDSIFIKKYIDILKIKNVQGKSLFIGNYRFNLDSESNDEKIIPLKDISMLVGDTNRLYFIDLYTIDDSYIIYG